MAGGAYDGAKRITAEHNPLISPVMNQRLPKGDSQARYDEANDGMLGWLSGAVIGVIKDISGIDLSGWIEFLEGLPALGMAAIEGLVEAIGGLWAGIVTTAQAFANVLINLPIVQDIIEIITGQEDGDVNDLGSWANGVIGNITQTVDNIVNGLFGWLGFGQSQEDAAQALADNAASVSSLSASVQALQSNRNNEAVGGVSNVVDFRAYANSTSLPAVFDTTYSGSGTGVLGVQDGMGAWLYVNNAPRKALFDFNVQTTATDFQKIGIAFATAPVLPWLSSNPAHNYILGRCNAAVTSYVYVKFTKTTWEIGCVVSGGAPIVWYSVTSGFSFKANGIYWLECGGVGGDRYFRVMEGDTPLRALTEPASATMSKYGEDPSAPGTYPWRGTGGGVYAYANTSGTNVPGKMLAFAMADNNPPTLVGSGARMWRTSTTGVTATAGSNLLPNSFFGVKENTADIAPNLTTGAFAVSIDGWYDITFRTSLVPDTAGGIGPPYPVHLLLYKNGSVDRYFGDPIWPYAYSQPTSNNSAIVNTKSPEAAHGSCRVFLQEGDYVQIGYNADATSTNVFTGDSGGLTTYFSITLANRSLA